MHPHFVRSIFYVYIYQKKEEEAKMDAPINKQQQKNPDMNQIYFAYLAFEGSTKAQRWAYLCDANVMLLNHEKRTECSVA